MAVIHSFSLFVLAFVVISTMGATNDVQRETYSLRNVDQEKELDPNKQNEPLRPRRAIPGVLAKVGQFVFKTLASFGINTILDQISNSDSNNELRITLTQIENKLTAMEQKLQHTLLNHIIDYKLLPFTTDIKRLNLLMTESIDILNKEAPSVAEQMRRNQVLDQILDSGSGIEQALQKLHLTLTGRIHWPGMTSGHILDIFWQQITLHEEMDSYNPSNSTLFTQTRNFIEYFLELQQMGYAVWFMTIRTQSSLVNDEYQSHLENVYQDRSREQEHHLSTIFKPCNSSFLETYRDRCGTLVCSDGVEFQSICHHKTAGDWRTQLLETGRILPNKGYGDIQCLIHGQWSTNVYGQTILGCTYDFGEIDGFTMNKNTNSLGKIVDSRDTTFQNTICRSECAGKIYDTVKLNSWMTMVIHSRTGFHFIRSHGSGVTRDTAGIIVPQQ